MKSHEYRTSIREVLAAFLPALLVLAALAGLLRLGLCLGIMPRRAIALDPQVMALAHQARAARSQHPAEILLLGDSTCMLDLDARALGKQLPGQPRVLNLGLIIFLDFNTYAEAMSDFMTANPDQVRAIILLVAPDKLEIPGSGADGFWRSVHWQEQGLPGAAPDPFALRCLRENLLGHILATPLPGRGEGAARFGFASVVDAYMTAHDGSGCELGQVVPVRQPPQSGGRFADSLEVQSRAFRARVPRGVKLLVGFTPFPRSYSSPDDYARRLDMLNRWNRWIQADALLTNLPSVWPDAFFASKSHLNELGQNRFTAVLASQIAPLLKETDESF